MLGRLEFSAGGRGRGELTGLYGLPILLTRADTTGRFGEMRVRRAGRTMKKAGVVRTLLPTEFGEWALL